MSEFKQGYKKGIDWCVNRLGEFRENTDRETSEMLTLTLLFEIFTTETKRLEKRNSSKDLTNNKD